jgi:prolyl 4-hydroxylase
MHLTAEWRDWVVKNLARGCDPRALIADMVRESFDSAFANAAVLGLAGAGRGAAAAPDSSFVYEPARLPTGNVISAAGRPVRVVMRLERPTIAVLDDLLSHEECDGLIRRSAERMQRSTTVDPVRGTHEIIPHRDSDGTYLPVNADPFIAQLDRRIAALMNWPLENGEGLQILRYRIGGQYTPHFDYFPPADPGSAAALAVGGQRLSSLVMYLNDVPEGGETVFPELNLTVVPKRGSAVYFEYCNSRGQVDPRTLHGGLPVLLGEKWIATKWMRQRRYGVV